MNGDSYASTRGGGTHGSSHDRYSSRRDRDDGDRDRGGRRRRSRSPGHRGSRRDYEVDTYSSSRDYREREREDRYAGRNRRDDRGAWDRDRGSRRDRRDDDERPRRDRDLFDDRGGRGGGGGRRDRDLFDRRERKRSATPPPKKKEPTPDLTDIIPIDQRKRRLTQWDIKPPGYENVTAEQAKLSGMFPLPGAPRQQQMDPSRLQALISQPGGSATPSALKASTSRQAKRMFVYNIPASATNESMQSFFNLHMNGLNVVSGDDACLSAHISTDRSYALLEFKSAEDATVALAFDGLTMEDNNMDTGDGTTNGDRAGLSIRRPKDYIVPTAMDEDLSQGALSSTIKDGPNKILVTSIPLWAEEEQLRELLSTFGELKACVLAKEHGAENGRGFAFCEYADPEITDPAVEGLNGLEFGENNNLRVQKATVGHQQAAGLEMGVNAMSMLAGTKAENAEQGRVLQLLNMVTPEDLLDNEEYEEICEDVLEECQKFGHVLDMKIPRPTGSWSSPGVGMIFVKYDKPESAQKALSALAGRQFAHRTVVVTFFPEEYFDSNAW